MKTFKKFHKQNKFCWGDGDLEHHDSGSIKEDAQTFNKPASTTPNTKQFEEHGKSLSPETLGHIRTYKSYSNSLNNSLRTNMAIPEKHHEKSLASGEMAKHLDHATSHKLTEPMIVYRGGTGRNSAKSKTMQKVGHEFTDHGYTSTSMDRNIAEGFSDGRHVFAIHLKPGDKAHHFDMHPSGNSNEREIVLHRGTRFRVTGHSVEDVRGGKVHHTHLEIVRQKPRAVKLKQPKIAAT